MTSTWAQLPEAERHRILVEWNATQTEYPCDKCIHQLIEQQVERTPNAVALVFEKQQLTYADLNGRANQLAHYLQDLGVGPEVLVGICVERSLEMVVGLLGILKAGGAYVPLDPTYPSERLVFMLQDAAPQVLLTQQHLRPSLPEHAAQVFCLDRDWATLDLTNSDNLVVALDDDNLAYMIYTSGSTGRPKGTMNTHGAIRNRLLWMQEAYGLTQADKVLQKTPFSFDVSVWEFFWPLMTGAQLVVARPEGHKDSAYLLQTILEHGITTLHFVPSMLQLFVTEPGLESCISLQRIICSGEALPFTLQQRLFDRLNVELHNLYGPTEAAIDVTFWACERDSSRNIVPMGRPIANTQIHILDSHMQPVPGGSPGELYIGGVGLARGYLGRPVLTAEKFVPDPFSPEPNARLYRTGDLARYLPDGAVEYLGRIDHQVKIRGFLIELGEIESVLAQHPAVREVVVLAREDGRPPGAGDKRLVAYVVTDDKMTQWQDDKMNIGSDDPSSRHPVILSELRSHLRQKLPEYMIPSAFVLLGSLPLTPNGKVDRKALPALDTARPQLENAYAGPRTATEVALVSIWESVLGIQPVGIDDEFIALGGHSLLAVQIAARVREELHTKLPFQRFFISATVAQHAALVEYTDEQRSQHELSPIQPRVNGNQFPLSFSQQQLWLFDQMHPLEPVYNETFTFLLQEPVDVTALSQTFNRLIERHEILRTTFDIVNGEPVQYIHPPHPFQMCTTDLTHLPPTERETEAHRLATAELQERFDLVQGPLLRATLVKLADTDWRLFLSVHHIILDGVSMYGVFYPELETLYRTFITGAPESLPEPHLQYADYALWQHQSLTEDMLTPHLAYWKRRLSDLPILQLPTDRPYSAKMTYRGTRQGLALSTTLTEQLLALSKQEGVTLFMTLAAAFKVLLYRYTSQEDIVIGTAVDGRYRPELQSVLGNMVNVIPMRTRLTGELKFYDLLQRIKVGLFESLEHKVLPTAQIAKSLKPLSDSDDNPLLQVVLVLEPPLSKQELGWTLSQLEIHSGATKGNLALELDQRPQGIIGRVEYSTDLFDDVTITRMIGHFQMLLEAIVADPTALIAELPLLTPAEYHQIVHDWNATQTDYPKDQCLHHLFEQQVERTPDAVAVVFENQQVTYAELNCRANQLAHHLRGLGVGPEVLVGLCVERSVEMVVGLLGILKAGGAYVPLDPTYPLERLAFMLQDAAPKVLLTQQRLLAVFSEQTVVCLDSDWERIALAGTENPNVEIENAQLAYVIYTSGTTGRAKGVMVQHQGLCNMAATQAQFFRLPACGRVLQHVSPAFDASLCELTMALVCGSTIVLIGLDQLAGEALYQFVRTQRITTMALPPSLLATLPDEPLPDLSTVITGAEPCPQELVRRWANGRTYFNAYGPTETTVTASVAAYDPAQPPSIGRPTGNVQIYLLDDQLQPVPVGVPGELHIGGVGVARGYLQHPGLTAEKFIPHPFSQELGARLYRTGDLARYLPDGNIEFLGRIDHQVKLRGFRIELGEIEAVLAQHPAVRECVVLAREDEPGHKRLVAYVVMQDKMKRWQEDGMSRGTDGLLSSSTHPVIVSVLRSHLQQKLPEYMVPSAFVLLDSLPLTPNGKLDRKALPAPDGARPDPEQVYVGPRTVAEETLATIWAEVLRVERVGIHDNFFELGGDSILCFQVLARAQKHGLTLSLQQLLENPTVAKLAQVITSSSHAPTNQQLVVDSAPLTPIQRRFFQQNLSHPHLFNSYMVLTVAPDTNATWLRQALDEVYQQHDALRMRFVDTQGETKQQLSAAAGSVLFRLVDCAGLAWKDFQTEMAAEMEYLQHKINITNGPLMQAALFQRGADQPGYLFWTIHHLVVDGVSWRMLLEDLQTAYAQLSRGEPVQCAPKTSSFLAWADWLTKTGPTLVHHELAYWVSQFEGATSLPADPSSASANGEENGEDAVGSIQQALSPAETQTLLRQAPAVYQAQINDLLLTALGQSLTTWAGTERVLIEMEGHGREHLTDPSGEHGDSRADWDLSRTVGWFTTTFPVRLERTEGDTRQAVGSVKRQLQQIPNRGIGYGILRYLRQEPALQQAPPLEVSFNYLGQFDQVVGTQSSPNTALLIQGLAPQSHGLSMYTADHLCGPPLAINALVVNGQFQVSWSYPHRRFQQATIETLASAFLANLRTLLADCQPPGMAQPARSPQPQLAASASSVRFVNEPLFALLQTGSEPPVDAAALSYWPVSVLDDIGVRKEEVIHGWAANQPAILAIYDTLWGRIAYLMLPRTDTDLYADPDLQQVILNGLEMAQQIGARAVSLLGVIPSATEYGRAIAKAITHRPDLPAITTGHAVTASAVVLNIHKLLQEAGRTLEQEEVACVGLGSIGRSALRLMLYGLPHPRSITLCDFYQKAEELEQFRQELLDCFGYRGMIRIAVARREALPEIYQSTLIVGATSVPNVLDIAQLAPGTLLVDYAPPPCFDTRQAIHRFQHDEDILFTEASNLQLPQPMARVCHRGLQAAIPDAKVFPMDATTIGGCVLAGLLPTRFTDLEPTVGLVEFGTLVSYYQKLCELGIGAPALQCNGFLLSPAAIQRFRLRFGHASDGHRLVR